MLYALQIGISELSFASVSKRVQVQNLSNENELDLHEIELVSKTHFHLNGFSPGLVLKQKQKELDLGPYFESQNYKLSRIFILHVRFSVSKNCFETIQKKEKEFLFNL